MRNLFSGMCVLGSMLYMAVSMFAYGIVLAGGIYAAYKIIGFVIYALKTIFAI